jgi:hypothetical protein
VSAGAAAGPPGHRPDRNPRAAALDDSGRSGRGKWYDELFTPRDVTRFSAIYVEVMKSRQPHHYHSDFDIQRLEGREHIRYERLICPLAADGVTVDMLAGIVVFLDGPA